MDLHALKDVHKVFYSIRGYETDGLLYDKELWNKVTRTLESHGIRNEKGHTRQVKGQERPSLIYLIIYIIK